MTLLQELADMMVVLQALVRIRPPEKVLSMSTVRRWDFFLPQNFCCLGQAY